MLRLQRVEIFDFRTFRQIDITVPPQAGLTILAGPNGVGKSNFFDALEWGLTGAVQRFRQRAPKAAESDYLTRTGCSPGSHRVHLEFDDGTAVNRGPADTTNAEDVIKILRSPSWGAAITDISTYLGLTHFLGQAAAQRFTNRTEKQQWLALKGPAGVDDVETIRNRLAGRGARNAFARRLTTLDDEVERRQGQLSSWDALVERIRRLERSAAASGAISPEGVLIQARGLAERVRFDWTGADAGPTATASMLLEDLREFLRNSLERSQARATALSAAAELVTRFVDVSGAIKSIDGSRQESEDRAAEAEDRVAGALEAAQAAEGAWRAGQEARHRLERRVELLESLAADQTAIEQGRERKRRDVAERDRVDQLLVELRKRKAATGEQLENAEARRKEAADLAAQMQRMRAMGEDAVRLHLAQQAAAEASTRAEAAASHQQAILVRVEELRRARARLAETVVALEVSLAASQESASELARALSSLAAHVAHDAEDCPVCLTTFPKGEIARLAAGAASRQAPNYSRLEATLSDTRAELDRISTEISQCAALQAEHEHALGHARSAASTAERLASEVAVTYGLREAVPLSMQANVETELARLRAELEAVPAMPSATIADWAAAVARFVADEQQLKVTLADSISRISQTDAQIAAAVARVDERLSAVADVEPEAIGEALRSTATALVEAIAHASELAILRKLSGEALQSAREYADNARTALANLAGRRIDLTATRDRLCQSWASLELPGDPAGASLEAALEKLVRGQSALQQALAQQQTLGAALASSLAQDELMKARSLAGVSMGEVTADFDVHRRRLVSSIGEAQSERQMAEETRDRVFALSAELQKEAQAFSSAFLEPLNDSIEAFNRALLTTPGTSIAFSARLLAERTAFEMSLRRRAWAGDAPDHQDIDPQLYLSEGQMAANGFSILCSASVSYPWSRWRALLLDDPLQHNDVIHAAAFVDLMRNLVELEGYQLIISSHDRAEVDFMERKFTAAGLACTICHLRSSRTQGTIVDAVPNAFAAPQRAGGQLVSAS